MAKKEFSIQDIISNDGINIQDPINGTINDNNTIEQESTSDDTPTATPVRYEGGETEKDSEGNYYSKKEVAPSSLFKWNSIDYKESPLKAKKGEPQYGYEWAEEAAQMAWDTGKSADEIEAEMNKKWPLAAAQIKDSERTGPRSLPNGGMYLPYYVEAEGEDETGQKYKYYKSPIEQMEDKIAERYALSTEHFDRHMPSKALSLINKVPDLKKAWSMLLSEDYTTKLTTIYDFIGGELEKLKAVKSSKELKKLGFNSQEELDRVVTYINLSRKQALIKYADPLDPEKAKEEVPNKEPFKEEEHTNSVMPTAEKAKEEVPNKEPFKEEYTDSIKPELEKAKEEEEVPNKEPANTEPVENNTEPVEDNHEEDDSFSKEIARLDAEIAEQEKQAQEEAEKIANREKSKKEAEKVEAELEKAARKAREKQFEYEDWLRNPTLISGIFGKSGLSAIKRVGLGLATLFSIFSDVAANYGRGINNNTDFRNAAMDELNSTIKKIQDTRAESIGKMAAKPYETTTEIEEAVNRDYLKLRKDGIGTYIPESTLKMFIQESQINTDEPLSEDLYERLTSAAREGYIESRKKNKILRMRSLDEDGNLNPEGEVEFLKNQERFIKSYRNALGISKERMSNIDARLAMDLKRAEVRDAVHKVTFNTNKDYIDAINALTDENRVLSESKLGFTSALTLSSMLDLAGKNRSVIAGLSTSNTNKNESATDSESSLERYTNSKGFNETKETLEKEGWQVELNGEIGTKKEFKLLPIAGLISGGGKRSKEEAEKFLRDNYEKWSNDDQKSKSINSSVSTAAGKNIDDTYDDIINYLKTAEAKGAEADFEAVRKQVLDVINSKIDFNNQVIEELRDMRSKESRFDTGTNDSASTINPYVSMFNDVPTKNSDWYRYRLGLS